MQALLPAVLLAALAAPALADVGSSASLTGLRYELVDLAPGDGIAPTVRFTGLSLAESLSLWHWCVSPRWCQRSQGSFTTPAFSSVHDEDTSETSVFAAVSAAGLFAGGQYANSIPGLGSGNGQYFANALYRGVRGGHPLFVLSAHTGLRITGQYTLDAWVDPYQYPGLTHGTHQASAAVFFHSRFLDGPAPLVAIEALPTFPDLEPVFLHETGEISALLRNDLDRQATVWGRWGVAASGEVPTSIPEASTWALLLAGVGVLGGVAQRRRSRDTAG